MNRAQKANRNRLVRKYRKPNINNRILNKLYSLTNYYNELNNRPSVYLNNWKYYIPLTKSNNGNFFLQYPKNSYENGVAFTLFSNTPNGNRLFMITPRGKRKYLTKQYRNKILKPNNYNYNTIVNLVANSIKKRKNTQTLNAYKNRQIKAAENYYGNRSRRVAYLMNKYNNY
jgi:hypothetical protein